MSRPAHLTTPRSTLFSAAVDLINGEPDHLARLCMLRDAFPLAPLREIQRTLLEAAVHLHVYAESVQQRRDELARTPSVVRP